MERKIEIKPPVEVRYEKELKALAALDEGKRPVNWKLSPRAVRTFILGSQKPLICEGEEISIRKKYVCSHQRHQHEHHSGDGRDYGGYDQIQLELCAPAGKGAGAGGSGAVATLCGDGAGDSDPF